MIVKNKMKQICIDKNMTLNDLAKIYGMDTKAFYVKLQRNTIKLSDAEKMAECLDCDIVFRDRKTGKLY